MTGIPFGKNFDENITGYTNIITNNRTKGFGPQVKRRFTIGAYITQNKNYEGIFKKAERHIFFDHRTAARNCFAVFINKIVTAFFL